MHWHYQVIQYKDHAELVEAVHFEADKSVGLKKGTGYSGNLLLDWYENAKDIEQELERMLKDVRHYKSITNKKAGLKYETIQHTRGVTH